MTLIKSIQSKLEKRYGKTFIENKGLFMLASGTYDLWSSFFLNVGLTLYYVVLMICTVYYSLFVKVDYSLAPEAIHYSGIFSVAVIFAIVFRTVGNKFRTFLRLLEDVNHDYQDTIDPDTQKEIDDVCESTLKRKNFLSRYLALTYYMFGIGNVYILPILSGRYSREENDEYVTWRVPLVKVSPYYCKTGPGWYVATVLDVVIVLIVVTTLNAIDIPFLCFSEEGCKQLDIVSTTIKNAFRRAKFVFKKKYGRDAESYQCEEFRECINLCMRESVKHHVATIRFFHIFSKAYTLPVFVVFLSGAFLLCASGIIIISKKYNAPVKIAFINYIAGELFHTFVFAYYGERMSQSSSDIHEIVYLSGWADCSKAMKPFLSVMQAYTLSTKIKLTALGFVDYNFSTFGNVISTAYSYFNLLSASTDF